MLFSLKVKVETQFSNCIAHIFSTKSLFLPENNKYLYAHNLFCYEKTVYEDCYGIFILRPLHGVGGQ